jgi:hypothetical protein
MANGNYDRELGAISSDLKHLIGGQHITNERIDKIDAKVQAALNKTDAHDTNIMWLRRWCGAITAAIGAWIGWRIKGGE